MKKLLHMTMISASFPVLMAAAQAQPVSVELSCSRRPIYPEGLDTSPVTLKLTIRSDTVGLDLGSRRLVARLESNDKVQLVFETDEFIGEYFHYTGDLFLINRSGNLARLACQRN
jgi:hypothetical protein